jgi:phosphoglycerate dehydrogenase-like enzyme
VGFVGYGAIARATHALLQPFNVRVMAYDPWLADDVAVKQGVTLCTLDTLMQGCRCVFVTASPTRSNFQLINKEAISQLADAALLVVLSRAHLVDFEALVDAANSGRIRVAIDVFPDEPLDANHRARQVKNIILSPHRAAAIHGGRQLIGDMLLHDLKAKQAGIPKRRLQPVPDNINELMGVGDADAVGSMAVDRNQE